MSVQLRRPRDTAMMMAPNAPMAPPSVGVAMPKKMVPNTKKINNKGGISTNVTRSAMRESRFNPKFLFATASTKASKTPAHSDTTMVSSVGGFTPATPLKKEITVP